MARDRGISESESESEKVKVKTSKPTNQPTEQGMGTAEPGRNEADTDS